MIKETTKISSWMNIGVDITVRQNLSKGQYMYMTTCIGKCVFNICCPVMAIDYVTLEWNILNTYTVKMTIG